MSESNLSEVENRPHSNFSKQSSSIIIEMPSGPIEDKLTIPQQPIPSEISPILPTMKHRVSRTQAKPMLSSLEDFDPSQSALWLKKQTSRITNSPQYQEAIKYAQIDFYRRYFYIEPQQLKQRLLDAYKPSWPRLQQEIQLLIYGTTHGAMVSPKKISPELYGPLMIVLTLAAIIPFDMHHASASSNPGSLRETTIISSALITTFSYWGFATILTFWIVQQTKTLVNIVQVASIIGYSMTSTCIVIGLGGITERATNNSNNQNTATSSVTTAFNNTAFYLLWIFVGGLANLRLALTLVGRTPHVSQDKNDLQHRLYRISVGFLPFFLNMTFMLYLHFTYHYFVEAVIDQIPG